MLNLKNKTKKTILRKTKNLSVISCFQHITGGLLMHLINPLCIFNLTLSWPNQQAYRRNFFRGGRAKIAPKILLHKNMLMIRSTINILPLVFTYVIICLRIKKMSLWFWKQSHFWLKRFILIGIQLIKECKSIVNGLIETI